MKLAVVIITLVASSSRVFAGPDVIDLGPPARHLRLPTTIDIGPPTRGPTPAEPPARPGDPVAPVPETTSVGPLGALIGAPVMLYVLAKVYGPKLDRSATRDGWRKRRGSSGYASLVPDIRKVREVSIVPSATAQSVHTGISLRW